MSNPIRKQSKKAAKNKPAVKKAAKKKPAKKKAKSQLSPDEDILHQKEVEDDGEDIALPKNSESSADSDEEKLKIDVDERGPDVPLPDPPSGVNLPKDNREGFPFIKDQIERYPDSVSLSRVMSKVFTDISDKTQEREYNMWLTKVELEDGYELQSHTQNFNAVTGKYVAAMIINILRFENPVPKGSPTLIPNDTSND